MNFSKIQQNHWKQVKEIYMEAFPKRERKPFRSIYHSVQKGKAAIFTALEVHIPRNLRIRSEGTERHSA